MVIIDLMIIILFIWSCILLSGIKIMIKPKYAQVIIFLLITYNPMLTLIEGYKVGYTGIISIIILSIVFLLIFIWGYRRNRYTYTIHNVKQSNVISIIEVYLKRKNIEYEIIETEIYLAELHKTIVVNGLLEINLNCRDIKDMDFYIELVDEIRVEMKQIKRIKFSIEGIVYLTFVVILYWTRNNFLMIL